MSLPGKLERRLRPLLEWSLIFPTSKGGSTKRDRDYPTEPSLKGRHEQSPQKHPVRPSEIPPRGRSYLLASKLVLKDM